VDNVQDYDNSMNTLLVTSVFVEEEGVFSCVSMLLKAIKNNDICLIESVLRDFHNSLLLRRSS
jgi:hypothetical protein